MDQIHITPINDLREHVLTAECWCRPMTDEDGLVVHNAMDQRETYEQGRKLQ